MIRLSELLGGRGKRAVALLEDLITSYVLPEAATPPVGLIKLVSETSNQSNSNSSEQPGGQEIYEPRPAKSAIMKLRYPISPSPEMARYVLPFTLVGRRVPVIIDDFNNVRYFSSGFFFTQEIDPLALSSLLTQGSVSFLNSPPTALAFRSIFTESSGWTLGKSTATKRVLRRTFLMHKQSHVFVVGDVGSAAVGDLISYTPGYLDAAPAVGRAQLAYSVVTRNAETVELGPSRSFSLWGAFKSSVSSHTPIGVVAAVGDELIHEMSDHHVDGPPEGKGARYMVMDGEELIALSSIDSETYPMAAVSNRKDAIPLYAKTNFSRKFSVEGEKVSFLSSKVWCVYEGDRDCIVDTMPDQWDMDLSYHVEAVRQNNQSGWGVVDVTPGLALVVGKTDGSDWYT